MFDRLVIDTMRYQFGPDAHDATDMRWSIMWRYLQFGNSEFERIICYQWVSDQIAVLLYILAHIESCCECMYSRACVEYYIPFFLKLKAQIVWLLLYIHITYMYILYVYFQDRLKIIRIFCCSPNILRKLLF